MASEPEDKKSFWTGAHTLNVSEPGKQFGFVFAESTADKPGTVSVILRTQEVSYSIEGDAIKLSFSEDNALELQKKLSLVNSRIEHLRALHRLGLLKEAAFGSGSDRSKREE